jgi:hypothetical protein
MSSEFKNEIFFSYEPNPVRACNHCGEKPRASAHNAGFR